MRFGQQVTAGVAFPLVHGAQNEGLLLVAHAAQTLQSSVACRRLEVVDRLDAELGVQLLDGTRTDTLKVEEVEDRRWKLGEQRAVEHRAACFCHLADPRGEIASDAGQLQQLRLGHPGHGAGSG